MYVDDLLITGDDVTGINDLKVALDTAFTIKDLGHARYFLGLELYRIHRVFFLTKENMSLTFYVMQVLLPLNLQNFPYPRASN